ncbi:MAG: GNAT family acetyltransferase [Cyanobacteria bacterium J06638_20]
MKIRTFQSSDREAVVQLWKDCGLVVPHNNPQRDIDRKLTVMPEWFLIGEMDAQVMASCMVGYEGHRGWLNYLAVRPDMQKRGFGQQIVAHAEALLLKAGCPKINLQIRSTNQRVIEFYEGLGYKQDPVINLGKRLIPDSAT